MLLVCSVLRHVVPCPAFILALPCALPCVLHLCPALYCFLSFPTSPRCVLPCFYSSPVLHTALPCALPCVLHLCPALYCSLSFPTSLRCVLPCFYSSPVLHTALQCALSRFLPYLVTCPMAFPTMCPVRLPARPWFCCNQELL